MRTEDKAFSRLLAYSAYQWPRYRVGAHHRRIAAKLEAVERGDIKRLMILMPPRHGKSMITSEFFPAWYLGRNPDHYIIAATYAQEFADDIGRKVRNQLTDPDFRAIFPGVMARSDSTSAKRFHTTQGGSYFAVGVGGPATGRGAHLFLIDDPLKNREDAESEAMRRKLKDWYTSVAYTRLMPGGAIVNIQCMTGDTSVLMADGKHKNLSDIHAGDLVSSYKNGNIVSAKVKNWKSQGLDCVYAIKTTSGIVVRANERHPFLVLDDGELRWIRTRDLRQGHEIVRVNGESGKEKSAHGMAATSPLNAVHTANPITTKSAGPMALERRPSMACRAAALILSTVTALLPKITTNYCLTKMGSAQSADCPPVKTSAPIGVGSFASITATTRGKLGHFFATIATSLLGTQKRLKLQNQQRNTSDFTTDAVGDVVFCGNEEVFDIQVEGTENFIANGLVSHNTRWHEDDLAGWLLAEHAHEGWDVLSLPAIDDDGEALWPEAYPLERLREIERTIGPRDWASLYQQRPAPAAGALFDVHKIQIVDALPAGLTLVRGWDLAATRQVGTNNPDWTVGALEGRSRDGVFYIADIVRLRGGPLDVETAISNTADADGRRVNISIPQDPGQAGKAQALRYVQMLAGHNVMASPETGDKATRAAPLAAQIEAGNVRMLRAPWNRALIDEMVMFPNGTKDDQVDALSRAFAELSVKKPMSISPDALKAITR